MQRQLPSWFSAAIIVFVAITAVCFLGLSTRSPEQSGVNKPAPAIDGTLLDGSAFHLSDYRGKVVLLNFWGTWCGPCRQEIPDLAALQTKYGPRGFTIVGLADDDDPNTPNTQDNARVAAFAKETGINYPNLLIPEGLKSSFGIEAFPTTFLVDKNGNVVYATVGMISSDTVSAEIEKLLK